MRCKILKTKCSRSVWSTRACRLRGKRLLKRGGASASESVSHKTFLFAAGVIKAAVTKVLEKQKRVRLLPPELSPSYHANAFQSISYARSLGLYIILSIRVVSRGYCTNCIRVRSNARPNVSSKLCPGHGILTTSRGVHILCESSTKLQLLYKDIRDNRYLGQVTET